MKDFILSIKIGWGFLFHPQQTTDRLFGLENDKKIGLIFIIMCASLWSLQGLYVNLVRRQTARGREMVMGVSIGPDILVSLSIIPLAILVIAIAASISSAVSRKFGGEAEFIKTFVLLGFTLNGASIFFDYPYELAMTFRPEVWAMVDSTFHFIVSVAVMFIPIFWALGKPRKVLQIKPLAKFAVSSRNRQFFACIMFEILLPIT